MDHFSHHDSETNRKLQGAEDSLPVTAVTGLDGVLLDTSFHRLFSRLNEYECRVGTPLEGAPRSRPGVPALRLIEVWDVRLELRHAELLPIRLRRTQRQRPCLLHEPPEGVAHGGGEAAARRNSAGPVHA